jgi:hypothetical protein
MTLYKISYIFEDYITAEEIDKYRKNPAEKIDTKEKELYRFFIDLYGYFAAKYILLPFQMPETPAKKQRVISFKMFCEVVRDYVENLLEVKELNMKLEAIEFNKSERIFEARYKSQYAEYIRERDSKNIFGTLNEYSKQENIKDISNFIDTYRDYLSSAIQFLFYLSAGDDLTEMESEILKPGDEIQNACISFYKETCEILRKRYNDAKAIENSIAAYNSKLGILGAPNSLEAAPPAPAPAPKGASKRKVRPNAENAAENVPPPKKRGTRRNRKAHKTRRKNRK